MRGELLQFQEAVIINTEITVANWYLLLRQLFQNKRPELAYCQSRPQAN